MIVLSCMDLDLAIRTKLPVALINSSTTKESAYYEKWEPSYCMSPMIMKHTIMEPIRGSIPEEKNAQKYLAQVADHFAKTKRLKQVPFLVILFKCDIRAKET